MIILLARPCKKLESLFEHIKKGNLERNINRAKKCVELVNKSSLRGNKNTDEYVLKCLPEDYNRNDCFLIVNLLAYIIIGLPVMLVFTDLIFALWWFIFIMLIYIIGVKLVEALQTVDLLTSNEDN